MKKIFIGIFLIFLVMKSFAENEVKNELAKPIQIFSEKIEKSKVLELSACLMDAFDNAHSIVWNVHFRQQLRPEGYRIDGIGVKAFVRVDILNTGDVFYYEFKKNSFIDTTPEKEFFKTCISKITSQ